MKARFGVVCTSTRDAQTGRVGRNADSYVIAADGRVAWLEGDAERSTPGAGRGALLAVADGEGTDRDAAQAASTAACRVLAKVWQEVAPRDRVDALGRFLAETHARLGSKLRERDGAAGASVAVAWLDGDELVWARIGSAQVLLYRDDVLRPLAQREGRPQRFLASGQLEVIEGREIGAVTLREGDQVVLATDGFLRSVDPPLAVQILMHVDDAQTAAVSLMERALARGAADNVTVLVADLRPGRTKWSTVRTKPDDGVGKLGAAITVVSDPLSPPPAVRTEPPPVRQAWRSTSGTDPS